MSRPVHIESILQWLVTQGHLSLVEARSMAERMQLDGDRLSPPDRLDALEAAQPMDLECALDEESTASLEAEIERSGVFERARQRAITRRLQHAREKSMAPWLYARLMDLPETVRRERLHQDKAYHTRAVVDLMLGEAKEAWHQDIHRAEVITLLALDLLGHLDTEQYGRETLADLGAKVWAYQGNVDRLRLRWKKAAAAFHQAEEHLAQGSGDLLLRAGVWDLKATLHGDLRELDTRLRILEEVIAVYREMGETHLAGRTLVGRANTLWEMARVEEAIHCMHQALDQLDPQQDPRLQFFARHNLMFFLCEAGREEEAARLLEVFRPHYLQYPVPAAQLRLRWLEGKIALGTGSLSEAEAAFAATQKGWEEQGEGYDSALAALDLAAVYAMQGRTADLKRLATELFTTFQTHDIHREAYAALILFRQAADLDQVGLEVVKKVASLIDRSQHLPPDQPS
jgi:tetratricopeptide (TPR) repeat protein